MRFAETGVGGTLSVGGFVQRRWGSTRPAALEAIASAVHLDDVDVVGEAVQQATVSCSGPKTWVHSPKDRLVVTRMDPNS